MRPSGPLMIEHRLIERMVKLLTDELRAMKSTTEVSTLLLAAGVDFFCTYADRTHHGKEEGILFRELAARPLSREDRQMMHDLVDEHIFMREVVELLAAANERYVQGADVRTEIMYEMDRLVTFYPLHIRKEDKQFFPAAMGYFSQDEQEAMIEEFWEFDRAMIHEKYQKLVEENEKAPAR